MPRGACVPRERSADCTATADASASRNPDAKSTSNAKAADREPNLTLTTDPDH